MSGISCLQGEQVEAQKLRKTGLSPKKSDSCTVLPWESSMGKEGAGLACWEEEEEEEEEEPSDWLGSLASWLFCTPGARRV